MPGIDFAKKFLGENLYYLGFGDIAIFTQPCYDLVAK